MHDLISRPCYQDVFDLQVRHACYTKRTADSDDLILVGAKESYEPCCERCYSSYDPAI